MATIMDSSQSIDALEECVSIDTIANYCPVSAKLKTRWSIFAKAPSDILNNSVLSMFLANLRAIQFSAKRHG